MRPGLLLLILSAGMAGILLSCENKDCISFSRDYIILQFLDSTDNRKNIDVEYVTALGSSYLFYADTSFNRVALPIDTEEAQTTFIFGNADHSTDTLEIGYTEYQRLISESCGFELQFRQLEILDTSYPEAIVEYDELNLLNEFDVTVYH